jgi:hypothetical protein
MFKENYVVKCNLVTVACICMYHDCVMIRMNTCNLLQVANFLPSKDKNVCLYKESVRTAQ